MASTDKQLVQQMVAAAAAACDAKKAEDIRILALDPAESGLTDYFLICTGNSDRQNVAITDEIELRLKHDFSTYPRSVEGRRQGEWILMDYVDFIVHVFTPEKRSFYGLERLRKSVTVLSIAELSEELKKAIGTRTKRTPAKSAVKKTAGTSRKAKPSKASPTAPAKTTATKKAATKAAAAPKKVATKAAAAPKKAKAATKKAVASPRKKNSA